ncbi:hypothetical protein SESBI_50767 [Sesbania bispinosa]|nr:hypothetical protein SESBI_50767 [Sesbania bispinosa]
MVVIRIAQRTFAIAFPGLLYGLKLPKYCPEALFNRLTRVFEHFSHYKDINENNQGYPMVDDEQDMLNRLRPQIEHVAHEALKKLGHFPGISRFCIQNVNSCNMRAVRMSGITRLIVESMSTGMLKITHINVTGIHPRNQAYRSRAYASVSAFSWLIDSVELSWVFYSGHGHLLRDDIEPLGECNLKFQLWCLNKEGIVAFLHHLEHITEK